MRTGMHRPSRGKRQTQMTVWVVVSRYVGVPDGNPRDAPREARGRQAGQAALRPPKEGARGRKQDGDVLTPVRWLPRISNGIEKRRRANGTGLVKMCGGGKRAGKSERRVGFPRNAAARRHHL